MKLQPLIVEGCILVEGYKFYMNFKKCGNVSRDMGEENVSDIDCRR